MPRYHAPSTDAQRLNFIRFAINAATEDHSHGRFYITPEILADLNDLMPRLRDGVV